MIKFDKIRIKKSTSEKYWYSDKIGSEYSVIETSVRDYYVSDEGTIRGILISDADIINKKRED